MKKGEHLDKIMSRKSFRHASNHAVTGDDDAFQQAIEEIKTFTPKQVSAIFKHVRKMTAGVAVPVFYYRKEGKELFISHARYLDHAQNLPEAQYKLENGLTTNRLWSVLPEHQAAFDALKRKWEAKKLKEEKSTPRWGRTGTTWIPPSSRRCLRRPRPAMPTPLGHAQACLICTCRQRSL
jgi:hypothetical protein